MIALDEVSRDRRRDHPERADARTRPRAESQLAGLADACGDRLDDDRLDQVEREVQDRPPEPSGEEGLQDVRIITAIYESAETGKTIEIPPFDRARRPDGRQAIERPPVQKPELVRVEPPSE